jgi:hypothetical protein
MSLKRVRGRGAMKAFVASPAKKMRPRARTRFPFGLFRVRHGGAEKKFNRTGGTAGKTLAGGLALRETATRIRYRRIEFRAASAVRSHQAGGSDCRVEASVHDDLSCPLLPPIRISYVAEFGLLSVSFNRGTVD